MAALPPDWAEANRRRWDERVPIHLSSSFYDVDGFRAGRPAVEPFEIEELGSLGGRRLAHLQCHFGLDTLDLVRLHPTLEAVGLDFSPPAVASATRLASELGLDARVSFVEGEVRHAASLLGAAAFDVIYTGKGALCWLPNLDEWAAQCAALLRPGGELYLCEFHPVAMALDAEHPVVSGDYFRTGHWEDESPGTYADTAASTRENLAYNWNHPLPDVLSALIGAGFVVRFFHEFDYTLWPMATWLVADPSGRRWGWPPGGGRLPLMYSLKAFLGG